MKFMLKNGLKNAIWSIYKGPVTGVGWTHFPGMLGDGWGKVAINWLIFLDFRSRTIGKFTVFPMFLQRPSTLL